MQSNQIIMAKIKIDENLEIGNSKVTLGDLVKRLSNIPPIGYIYLSMNSTSPEILYGGTWKRLKDVFILACGDIYAAGSTGGEAEHTLIGQEIPSNIPRTRVAAAAEWSLGEWARYNMQNSNWTSCLVGQYGIPGGDQPHNNMPPYIAAYAWQRIA